MQQLNKSIDNADDKIFTESEVQEIFYNIREKERQELKEKLAAEKRMEELRKRIIHL